jgi:hypothetical protein
MSLSSELISQFAKITNDEKPKKIEEVTLYGEVFELEDMICVKFDGSEELTPVTTIAEKDEEGNSINFKYGAASVKSGDRVSVSLKNHSATITGNLSDPPAGRAEFKVNLDSIVATVGETKMTIDAMGVKFEGLETGETIINGGCIKTGKIDAQYLNLSGAITFSDLNQEVKDGINGANDAASDAANAASTALGRANTAMNDVEEALDEAGSAYTVARSIAAGNYIGGTFIDGHTIKSPTIEGNEIKVYGTFQTVGYDGVNQTVTGYMGAAMGEDSYGNDTLGVAMSNDWDYHDGTIGKSYVIVTNAGVRLQYGRNNVVVSQGGIYLNADDTYGGAQCDIHLNCGKAYYNDKEIGSGTGGTAVFG